MVRVPYSGFEPEPTRLQDEGHIHHTDWTKTCQTNSELLMSEITISVLTNQYCSTTVGPEYECSPVV
ncbi:UNVERIFIED_CONTAM: hypothetical protein NCL1_14162 [Trichonephila clavipes]